MRTALILHDGNQATAEYFQRLLIERQPRLDCRIVPLPFGADSLHESSPSAFLAELRPPADALIVGLRLGGLVAAKWQEQRPDLHVFALHAPTRAHGVELADKRPQRFALYSLESRDNREANIADWPRFAEAYDARWVYVRHTVAGLIAAYVEGASVAEEAARITARMTAGSRPRVPIPSIYLLHGKGGSPSGSVSKLELILAQHWPGTEFHRPLLPHTDPEVPAERSVEFLQTLNIPEQALLVGISLGGLVAAKFQELSRPDLHVICINSPTWADGVRLEQRPADRVSVYSSADEVIRGRTAEWPRLAEAYDYPWLTHDTDPHLKYLVRLIDWWLEGRLAISADRVRDVPQTKQERMEPGG